MARKPKVIETPGDSAPVSDAAKVAAHLMTSPANPAEKGAPQPEAATNEQHAPGYGEIIDRLGSMVLRRGIGWTEKE